MIGDSIEVVVTQIESGSVRLAVKAPRSLPIFRHEIYLKIQEANQASMRTPKEALPTLPAFKKTS
mgnify:CR=1 FL=1